MTAYSLLQAPSDYLSTPKYKGFHTWGHWFCFWTLSSVLDPGSVTVLKDCTLQILLHKSYIGGKNINHMNWGTLPWLICIGKMKCQPCTHAQEITPWVRKWENTQMPRRKLDLSILVLMYLWLLSLSDKLPHTPWFHSPNKVITLPETNKKQALTATLVHSTTSWWCALALEKDITGKLMSSQLPIWVCHIVHVLSQIS